MTFNQKKARKYNQASNEYFQCFGSQIDGDNLLKLRTMYYYLTTSADKNGNILGLKYQSDHRGRSFIEGIRFSNDVHTKPWNMPPSEPIVLTINPENSIGEVEMPSFLENPIPVMSVKMYQTIQQCENVNMDVYKAELRNQDGTVFSNDFVVFNLLDIIAAIDLSKSKQMPPLSSRTTDMSFESVVLKAGVNSPMFRLKENISSIFVHELVKNAIEKAGIPLVRFHELADIALL